MPKFSPAAADIASKKDDILHVYLAGPDVFEPDPIALGKRKKECVNAAGHMGHFPMDPELDGFGNNPETAYKIAKANEGLMQLCQVILVKMDPFRGGSMDLGTANEVGYMSCKYDYDPEHKVLIIGYYEGKWEQNYAQRLADINYKGQVNKDASGTFRDPEGRSIENFGLSDNLMIAGAIHKTGGEIYQSFQMAIDNIQQHWDKKFVKSNDSAVIEASLLYKQFS